MNSNGNVAGLRHDQFVDWTGLCDYQAEAPSLMLHELFERSAKARPAHVAVEFNGVQLSYSELEKRANQLANFLVEQGVMPDSKVAIMLPRTPFVYIAMLAVLKAGGAYIPLDPEIPGERVEFIMDDSDALLLISSSGILDRIASDIPRRTVFNVDADSYKIDKLPTTLLHKVDVGPSNLCYIIYTSGTTGKPKGVLLEHRNVVTYVSSAQKIYQIDDSDRALQGFSVAFDASVEEIWLPFAVGATIVVGTFDIMRSGDRFADILTNLKITFLSCAPTLLSMVDGDIPTLRTLIFGGEVCTPEVAFRWCKPNRDVFNTYGPTEAAVIASYSKLEPMVPVTIGRPMPGYLVMILNSELQPVGVGEEGEIFIGGEAIARGYLNKPELTDMKFITLDYLTDKPVRYYRSGDLAKYNDNGEIIFVGRADSQVKVRGFRVELSEIEGLIAKCDGVKSVVVALDKETQQLAAYVVTRDKEAIKREQITTLLRSKLPYYMVPATLDVIEALPMTSSSKVDRTRLPKPEQPLATNVEREIVEPQSELEIALVAMLKHHFSRTDISMDDNFFDDLGGHSLLAALIVSDLRKNPLFESMSVVDIYKHPIIAKLANEMQLRLDSYGDEKQEPQARDFFKPSRLRYYTCWFAQGVAMIFLAFLFGIEWLGPFFVYSYYYQADNGIFYSLLVMLSTYFALMPVLTIFAIIFKWLVIGRIKPGKYKLWGQYYFRFWLVDKVVAISPIVYFAGTPIINIFLRLLGAKIGRHTYINTHSISAFDLFEVGRNVSICTDSHLRGFTIKDGYLVVGSIKIEDDCFIGTRCCISENSVMESNSSLDDLTLVPSDTVVPANESWMGSPGQKISHNEPQEHHSVWNKSHLLVYLVGVFIIPLITMVAYFPGMMLITHVDYSRDDYGFLALTLIVAVSFVVMLGLIIVIAKWLMLGNIKEGRYPLSSRFYYKKWFFDQLMKLSLQVIGTLYTTLYLQVWFKMLGVKIGKRSEISTVEFISPDLLEAGDECFLADSVSVGASHVRNGYITIAKTRVGNRTFVGNSAVVSPGTVLGNDVLVGVLSKMKPDNLPAPDGTSWFGAPAVFLPRRDINQEFNEARTYKPSRKLFALRYIIEFFRVTLPATMFIILASMITNVASILQTEKALYELLYLFPFMYIGASIIGFIFMAILKWVVIGRYKPMNRPLWSGFVWRSEMVTGFYENFGVLFFMNMLTGTPFIKFPLWLLGCKIGRRTCIYTTQITEFDLVKVGDYSALNDNCTIQTHLFEDRVMKMSYVDIGKECSIGGMSVVLYDTKMEDGSKLDCLSVLMKGETLPANTTFVGAPSKLSSIVKRI